MRRTLITGAIALALTQPLPAQEALAIAAPGRGELAVTGEGGGPRNALLKESYQLRLVSDWPQLTSGDLSCVNGGQEVLEGRLTRNPSGGYNGQLTRKATIRFCGVHGGSASSCALTLTSEGTVSALATALLPTGNLVELRWFAPEGASQVLVEGDCSAQFNDSVRRLYLGASHSVEFGLPGVSEGSKTVRLDDYGWIVDVR